MFKWMSRIPDDKNIVLINIPSTHDSSAKNVNFFLRPFAKTQNLTILEQLNIGIRVLDIRAVRSGEKDDSDTDVITCHGICDCYSNEECCNTEKLTYKSILFDVRRFLTLHPTETIILKTDSGRGNKELNLERAEQIFMKYLGNMYINYNVNLTMGDCRGKVVNTLYSEEEQNKPEANRRLLSYVPNGTGIGEVHKKYGDFSSFKVDWEMKIQEIKDMFKLYNYTFDEAQEKFKTNPIKFPIQYSISCTGENKNCCPCPKWQADVIIPFMKNKIRLVKGKYYGWLNMDFAEEEFVKKMVETNFAGEVNALLNEILIG